MGFCRRCGNIVTEARCRCGGTSVAPVFAWNHEKKAAESQDSWSKTYVSAKKLTSPPSTSISTIVPGNTTSARRFPRPKSMSAMSSSSLSRGVSDHILATTSPSPRPPSPLKFSTSFPDPASDILPSFSAHEPTLSKVYGSVLQPKETLPLHSCAICSAIFPPDSTLYPNPSDPSDVKAFLCRQCFTVNGGSKGNCPSCSRPVLALKAEGGFIQSGGKYWHKGCFNCMSCFKNMGNTPMVDLFGRPSCADCFDNCLKRDHPATPKKSRSSANNSPNVSGRLSSSYGRKSREGSPMIGELEQRLGIVRSRESTPVVAETDHYTHRSPARSVSAQADSPTVHRQIGLGVNTYGTAPESPSSSPRRTHTIDSPYQRSISPIDRQTSEQYVGYTPSSDKKEPRHVIQSSNKTALDLTELSTALFQESPPKRSSRTSKAQAAPFTPSDSPSSTEMTSLCNKCEQPILNPRQGGQFVTIPGTDENDSPKLYHNDCFKCSVCEKPINDSRKGQASFVLASFGPCHVHCAPMKQHVVRSLPLLTPLEISARDILDVPTMISPVVKDANKCNLAASSRFERPLSSIEPKAAMPRFGGQSACPGCQKAVSPMERGVVPGPQGTRWHASCLVCGGKKVMTPARLLGREDKQKGPGCGKRLDSAAKSDGEGGIWCRECLLLIGVGGSPQTSPTRTPFIPSIDTSTKIMPQSTGTTTIARQFTGIASGESILRQLTGGGLSPTRSISPTKQLGMMKPGMRPRPKSVIGIRTTLKSIDEGRGMFLIKQMTGQGQVSASSASAV